MVSHACKNFHFFVGFSLPLPTALPVGNTFLSFPGGFLPGISGCSHGSRTSFLTQGSFKQTPMLVQNSPHCCCTWVSAFSWKFMSQKSHGRGQVRMRISLAWRGSFITPKSFPSLLGNAGDKDFSYCFYFMETF